MSGDVRLKCKRSLTPSTTSHHQSPKRPESHHNTSTMDPPSTARMATLHRCKTICDLIVKTFVQAFIFLSKLHGRSVEDFCSENHYSYIRKFFNPEDYKTLESDTPVDKYDIRLLHKLLKHCCGLAPYKDQKWKFSSDKDSIEFLITLCLTHYLNFKEASAMADHELNNSLDVVLEALIKILEKVESMKEVDLSSLKFEVSSHIGEKLDSYNDDPCPQHMFIVFSQYSLHQILVIVYKQLNCLHGRSLYNYLNDRRLTLNPRTNLSNERWFLQCNPPPEKMPPTMLYKVVQRVCFSFSLSHDHSSRPRTPLEEILRHLRMKHCSPLKEGQTYTEHCSEIYRLLAEALTMLASKKEKSIREIVQILPRNLVSVTSSDLINLPSSSTPAAPSCSIYTSPVESASSCTKPTFSSQPSKVMIESTSSIGTITLEEINVCLVYKMMRPGGVVAKKMAFIFKTLEGDITNLTNKVLKQFTPDEIKKMKGDLFQCDISLLCKLFRKACPKLKDENDKVWNTKDDTIEYYITCIKKHRNRIAHEDISYTTRELKTIFKDIEACLERILEITGDMLEKDLNHEIVDMKNELKEIVQSLHANNYLGDMEDLRKVLTNRMEANAKKELKGCYRGILERMSPFTWTHDHRHECLTTEKLFVERELEEISDIKADSNYTPADLLFSQKNELSPYRVIIIVGRAGDGKTSICKHLYHLWSVDVAESCKRGVDLLIFIPAKYVTTKSLSDYLKNSLPATFKDIDKDDIIPLMQQPQVLFVVDGYDEAGEGAKIIIDDILFSLPESTMIITSKPQWVPKLESKIRNITSCCKVLKIVELTEEKQELYVRNIFSAIPQSSEKRETECNKFLAYLDELREQVDALVRQPLTLTLMTLLWIENSEKAKTAQTITELYEKLIAFILKRLENQLNLSDSFYCHQWLLTLGKVAWTNLQKNQHLLSRNDLNILKREAIKYELGVEGNEKAISSLLRSEVQSSLTDSNIVWTFTHSTQQEHFSAEYIADVWINGNNKSLKEILGLTGETEDKYKKKLERLTQVIEFTCGLLVIHGEVTEERIKEIMEIMSVIEPWSFTSLMRMFQNLCKENKVVKNIIKTLFKNKEMDTFDRYDPQGMIWILQNTSLAIHKEVSLIQNLSTVRSIKPLLRFLLTKSHHIKIRVHVDKVSNISDLADISEDFRSEQVKFVVMPWNPGCIIEVMKNWPWSGPLYLSLCPKVYPLQWWQVLIQLLCLTYPVSSVTHSPEASTDFTQLLHEGATWLETHTTTDPLLGTTDVMIHVGLHKSSQKLTD